MAVGISFLSYGQAIRMAVVAERSVLPNPEVLTKEFIIQVGYSFRKSIATLFLLCFT
jgi:hypothetical protein